MRSIWVLISSFAVIIVIGGVAYYSSPEKETRVMLPHLGELEIPSFNSEVRNPLMKANPGQFHMWVPSYPLRCGEIVFEKADPKARNYWICVSEIRKRVAIYAQQGISREDVLAPGVQVRWREVMADR